MGTPGPKNTRPSADGATVAAAEIARDGVVQAAKLAFAGALFSALIAAGSAALTAYLSGQAPAPPPGGTGVGAPLGTSPTTSPSTAPATLAPSPGAGTTTAPRVGSPLACATGWSQVLSIWPQGCPPTD